MRCKIIFLACLLAGFSAFGQFKGTNGIKFGYAANLSPSDVLLTGRPGTTNYNLAGSNLLAYAQAAAGFYMVQSNQANLTLNDPFNLYSGGGSPVTWIFDILSGGGKSLSIAQSGGGGVTISDTGGFSADDVIATGGGFAGNGAGVSNVIAASVLPYSLNTNFTAKSGFWTMSPTVGSETAFMQGDDGWLRIIPDSGLYIAGSLVFDGASVTNLNWANLNSIPAGFADGVDDTGGSVYWTNIVGMPAGFADGVDDSGGGGGGSQTPLLSDIDAANHALLAVDAIYGNDAAHGSDLLLSSEDWDSRITLYRHDAGGGNLYESGNGHHFTGDVTFNNGVTFGGGITNSLPWSIASASISSATVVNLHTALTNKTSLATGADGELVEGSGAPWYYKSTHPKSGWTTTDLSTRYFGEYDDSATALTNCVWKVPFNCTATKLAVKVTIQGTLGSAEGVAHHLLINGTTIGLATTNAYNLAGPNWFTATGSAALTAGDVIALRVITPTFATDPTAVRLDWTVSGTVP